MANPREVHPMKVSICTQGIRLSREEHDHLHGRLRQLLARFGQRAMGATLHLSDVNGPRGGVDKECHLVVELVDTTTVVRDRGDHLRGVVDRVLHRAVQTIGRQFGKARDRAVRAPQLGRHRAGRNRHGVQALDGAGAAS